MRRRDVRPPSDWNFKQKARGGFLRPGFVSSRDNIDMPLICPTCQFLFSDYRNDCRKRSFSDRQKIAKNATKQVRRFETVFANSSGVNEMPAAGFPARALRYLR